MEEKEKQNKIKITEEMFDTFNLIDCSTGGIIKSYKVNGHYSDGSINRYLLKFDIGYVLEVDGDTPKSLIEDLIKKKKYVSIHFELNIFKDKKIKKQVKRRVPKYKISKSYKK